MMPYHQDSKELTHKNNQRPTYDVLIIGGGAAGFFTAIECATQCPQLKIGILEATGNILTKVKISGGGRCNVTHHEFEPRQLVKNYPRGTKELLGPFNHFGPEQTISWFQHRGIKLQAEKDGRMFPDTNSSQTIIDCFLSEIEKLGVDLIRNSSVTQIKKADDGIFDINTAKDSAYRARYVVLATGSGALGHELSRQLGHVVTSPVPSLFTFKIENPRLTALAGVSVGEPLIPKLRLKVAPIGDEKNESIFESQGPLLITHWGLSGPGILRLSAFAARELFASRYNAELTVHWTNPFSRTQLKNILSDFKKNHPKKKISTLSPLPIAKSLWDYLVSQSVPLSETTWAEASHEILEKLIQSCTEDRLQVHGRGIFKEEFVTAGGICRHEIDFRKMESKLIKGFYAVGEALDIDGVTGGFNFQNAWTSGYLAASAIAQEFKSLQS